MNDIIGLADLPACFGGDHATPECIDCGHVEECMEEEKKARVERIRQKDADQEANGMETWR